MEILTALSSISSDLTTIVVAVSAIVAAGTPAYYYYDRRSKRTRLEKYLKDKKCGGQYQREYQHTTLHLMAKLGMTEKEIFRASSGSKNIRRITTTDRSSGLAKDILFEYVDEPRSN